MVRLLGEQEGKKTEAHGKSVCCGIHPEAYQQLRIGLRQALVEILPDNHEMVVSDIVLGIGEVWTNVVKYEPGTVRPFMVSLHRDHDRVVCDVEWGGDPESGWLESSREAYQQRLAQSDQYYRQIGDSMGLGIVILDELFRGGVTYRPQVVGHQGHDSVVGVLRLVYLLG